MSRAKFVGLGVRTSKGGKGVFIHDRVAAGTPILEFTGKRFGPEVIDKVVMFNKRDYYLQVDRELFMGPSGYMDDYVNHSCNPNCGLEFDNGRIIMKSLRNISFGTELTIDYATTQSGFPLRFFCRCGDRLCRGDIGNFDEIPHSRQLYYVDRNVVAPYLLNGHRRTKTG